jgi:hypothetical protein
MSNAHREMRRAGVGTGQSVLPDVEGTMLVSTRNTRSSFWNTISRFLAPLHFYDNTDSPRDRHDSSKYPPTGPRDRDRTRSGNDRDSRPGDRRRDDDDGRDSRRRDRDDKDRERDRGSKGSDTKDGGSRDQGRGKARDQNGDVDMKDGEGGPAGGEEGEAENEEDMFAKMMGFGGFASTKVSSSPVTCHFVR